MYSLLDRPLPTSGVDITIDKIPQQLGQLLLFGKQTDRSARLELALFRPELPAAKQVLKEILGDDIAVTSSEVVIGHLGEIEHALSWHWRLPDDTPEEHRYKLALEKRRNAVLDVWPKSPQPAFGGRTAEQASAEPQYRNRLLAAIWLLELSDADSGPETYNQLRRKLNVPELTELDPAGLDINRLPLSRVARLKPEALSDEQLKHAFNRAVVTSFTLALKRLAPEVIKRPNMSAVEYKLSAYRVMVRMATNSAESMRLIEEARRLAEENKQSSAAWDLMELAFRIEAQRSACRAPAYSAHPTPAQPRTGRGPGASPIAHANRADRSRRAIEHRRAGCRGRDGFAVRRAGAATEPGKLWTPDAPQPSGEKKSSLWLPE